MCRGLYAQMEDWVKVIPYINPMEISLCAFAFLVHVYIIHKSCVLRNSNEHTVSCKYGTLLFVLFVCAATQAQIDKASQAPSLG